MTTLVLTNPVDGTTITAALHTNNYTALKNVINGSIDNANIASAAAIAYAKLNLALSIKNSDVSNSAGIVVGKLAGGTTGQQLQTTAGGPGWVTVPAARVYHDASQSVANNTDVALAFNQERFDTNGIHDTATNNSRLTCQTAGIYAISASIEFNAFGGTGRGSISIRLNGTTTLARMEPPTYGTGGSGNRLSIATIYQLAVNDYVEVVVRQESGGSQSVNTVGNYSPEFSMARVG
jgi:hypothetical protein